MYYKVPKYPRFLLGGLGRVLGTAGALGGEIEEETGKFD